MPGFFEYAVSDAMLIAGDKGRGVDWLSQPYAFEQVVRAVNRALNRSPAMADKLRGCAAPVSRAATFTPSPRMSSFSASLPSVAGSQKEIGDATSQMR